MAQTFSQFKTEFYARVPDLSVFDCEDFNLLKVVLDGLKVDYRARGIKDQAIFGSGFKHRLFLIARRLKYHKAILLARDKCKSVSKKMKVPYFFFDNARVAKDENGRDVSFYFNRIGQYLGWNNCVTIYQRSGPLRDSESVTDLFLATLFDRYSEKERVFILNLRKAYANIESLKVFHEDELFNIRVAITKFFNEYRLWNFILSNSSVKFALFDEHYHREGFILALKRKGIMVVELQHGLIAQEDIFYVFPVSVRDIANRALFPDRLFTYGAYWSTIVEQGNELKPEQISVLGAYQEINTYLDPSLKQDLAVFLDSTDFILITTQTFLHPEFTEYVEWLSADLLKTASNIKILVKIHPSENRNDYERIEVLHNVKVTKVNTEYLLSTCKWHISCYSTTLYDALKYKCGNFSLWIDKCGDYVQAFVQGGVSALLSKNQNPVNLQLNTAQNVQIDKSSVFESFEAHRHKLDIIELQHV